MQFASLNSHCRCNERDRFGDFLYAQKGSKCATHLEHESATRVAGSKEVKIWARSDLLRGSVVGVVRGVRSLQDSVRRIGFQMCCRFGGGKCSKCVQLDLEKEKNKAKHIRRMHQNCIEFWKFWIFTFWLRFGALLIVLWNFVDVFSVIFQVLDEFQCFWTDLTQIWSQFWSILRWCLQFLPFKFHDF